MPYKLEDLRAPGMDQNFHTVEGQVSQPAVKETPVSPETTKAPSKFPINQPLPKTKIDKPHTVNTSDFVSKAKDILYVLFLGLVGVTAVALVVRGIQFLFSI